MDDRKDNRWGIGAANGPPEGPVSATATAPGTGPADLLAVKSHIHRRLLERLNLANLDRLDRDAVMETILAEAAGL